MCDIDPNEPENMSVLLALELTQAEPQRFCLYDDASKNILSMPVTLDTSHRDISPLNDVARMNMEDMTVTLDTCHLEMSPLNHWA